MKKGPLNRLEFGNSLPEPTEPNDCQNGLAESTRTDASVYHYLFGIIYKLFNRKLPSCGDLGCG